jgi:bacteriocin-like protein
MNEFDLVTTDELQAVEGGMTFQPKPPPPDLVKQIIKWVLTHL